ncbi:MAG: winged helix-turn-helix transcriptional regulator [Candidatus Methanomethylophilaceae archaeon]|nr:winged helix-turn-helix transcriptional regulator [Candidatus Methanomethylophilaceae archaeon]
MTSITIQWGYDGKDRAMEAYSALANGDGGTISILHDVDETGPEIVSSIRKEMRLPGTVSCYLLTSGMYSETSSPIVKIEVPRAERSDRPVLAHGEAYIFDNGEVNRCSNPMRTCMERDASDRPDDRDPVDELTVDALDKGSIRRFRNIMRSVRPDHQWNIESDEAFLRDISATVPTPTGTRPTKAGLLMFGRENDITTVFPGFRLEHRELMGPDDSESYVILSYDGEWTGNLFSFYSLVSARIAFEFHHSDQHSPNEGSVRECVREGLVNALCHSDYHGVGGIVSEYRKGSVRISNPGTLRTRPGTGADPRNPAIWRMFRLIGTAAGRGTGLERMYEAWDSMGLVKPSLEWGDSPCRVNLVLGTTRPLELDPLDEIILGMMQNNGKCTVQSIAEALKLSVSAVNVRIRHLKEKGAVERIGGTRGKWVIQNTYRNLRNS